MLFSVYHSFGRRCKGYVFAPSSIGFRNRVMAQESTGSLMTSHFTITYNCNWGAGHAANYFPDKGSPWERLNSPTSNPTPQTGRAPWLYRIKPQSIFHQTEFDIPELEPIFERLFMVYELFSSPFPFARYGNNDHLGLTHTQPPEIRGGRGQMISYRICEALYVIFVGVTSTTLSQRNMVLRAK